MRQPEPQHGRLDDLDAGQNPWAVEGTDPLAPPADRVLNRALFGGWP